MKTHVLAAVVLAALASRVAVAASEGADTWSAVEPVQGSAYSAALQSTTVGEPAAALDGTWSGSEGGDTWSRFHAPRGTIVRQASADDVADRTDATVAAGTGGSEGGDTWSRFLPQSGTRPTSIASLLSNAKL
jgi:hypothetical protein